MEQDSIVFPGLGGGFCRLWNGGRCWEHEIGNVRGDSGVYSSAGSRSQFFFPAGAEKQEASWHSGKKAKGAFIPGHTTPATQ